MVRCQQRPFLLLCTTTTAAAAAAAAGESPHWHASSDLELWSTGTLSLETLSSLFPFPFILLVCLLLSPSCPPRAAVTISAQYECWRNRRRRAELMCCFRSRRLQNRIAERPLVRGVESILRSVNDLYRACTVMQPGGGGVLSLQLYRKSFNKDICLVDKQRFKSREMICYHQK